MPKRRVLGEEISTEAQRALTALNATSRLETLLFFKRHPFSTRQDLVAETNLGFGTSKYALEDLEALGYLVPQLQPGSNKPYRPMRYSLDRTRLASDLGDLMALVLG